jgi:hypothetical protein
MMNEQQRTSFRRQLLEQNGCADPGTAPMTSLISEERRKLRLIRNICIGVWTGFIFVLAAMALLILLRSMTVVGPTGPAVSVLHPLALLSTVALFGLMAAVAFTLVFYFRSRTVNLSGIEERLARMEQLLMTDAARGEKE